MNLSVEDTGLFFLSLLVMFLWTETQKFTLQRSAQVLSTDVSKGVVSLSGF